MNPPPVAIEAFAERIPPTLLLIITGFLVMVGLEELLDVALVGEGSVLLALPVLGIASFGIIAFIPRLIFLRPASRRDTNAATPPEL